MTFAGSKKSDSSVAARAVMSPDLLPTIVLFDDRPPLSLFHA